MCEKIIITVRFVESYIKIKAYISRIHKDEDKKKYIANLDPFYSILVE